MAYRTLEITLASAKGLKDVNLFFKMAVYAVVSLSDNRLARQRTPPDREGGRNPSWNSTLHLTIPADSDLACHFLHILLRTKRVLGDRDVGEVRVPLPELLSGAGDGPTSVQFVSYQVHRVTSGKPKGILNFSYKLSERVAVSASEASTYQPSTTAYPGRRHCAVPSTTSSSSYIKRRRARDGVPGRDKLSRLRSTRRGRAAVWVRIPARGLRVRIPSSGARIRVWGSSATGGTATKG
ncbi:unnamed protein product [Musa acuminata subsp. burmannicoides]